MCSEQGFPTHLTDSSDLWKFWKFLQNSGILKSSKILEISPKFWKFLQKISLFFQNFYLRFTGILEILFGNSGNFQKFWKFEISRIFAEKNPCFSRIFRNSEIAEKRYALKQHCVDLRNSARGNHTQERECVVSSTWECTSRPWSTQFKP